MQFRMGLGKDVHFEAGSVKGSVNDLFDKAEKKHERIVNPSEVQTAEQMIVALEEGKIAQNAARVADLLSPEGIITQQGEKITGLEVDGQRVSDTFQRELERAQRVQGKQNGDLSDLEEQVMRQM